MNRTLIIGTLHAGWTPVGGLQKELEKLKPDQLLVEICAQDIRDNKIDQYPPEMIFAYHWAKKNQIPVDGYDSKINVFREGVGEKENQAVIKKQKEQFSHLSWKDANKPENRRLFINEDYHRLVDPEKEKKREQEMLSNINERQIDQGTVVILTGCGHLDFFKKKLPGAKLPFVK